MFKKIIISILISLVFSLAVVGQVTEKSEPVKTDEDTILKLEKEYAKAMIDGGFKLLDSLISDSYTVWNSKGELLPTTKKDVIEDTDTKINTYETSGVDVTIKDGVAVVTGNLESERFNPTTGRFVIKGKFERTWKLKGGTWNITGYKTSVTTTPLDSNLLAGQVVVTSFSGSEVPTTWSTKIVLRIYGVNLNADGVRFGINGQDITTYITERGPAHVVFEAKDTKNFNIKGKKQDNEFSITVNGITKVVRVFTWK